MVKVLADDTSIYPILLELRDCLRSQYPANELCQVSVLVGDSISADAVGECGALGYVQLALGFPSEQSFPQPDVIRTLDSLKGYSVFMGVMRTGPTGDEDTPPSQEEWDEYSRLVLADMAAMNRAIRCCFAGDKFDDAVMEIQTYTPQSLEGGVGGGEWAFVVQEMQ